MTVKFKGGAISLFGWSFDVDAVIGAQATKVIMNHLLETPPFIDFTENSVVIAIPLGPEDNEPRWEITIEDMITDYIESERDRTKLAAAFILAIERLEA